MQAVLRHATQHVPGRRWASSLRGAGCRVNSHTEWDPLEEVIVGRVAGARIPEPTAAVRCVVPPEHWAFFERHGGKDGFDAELIQRAAAELDNLAAVLQQEGVVVRRPDILDNTRPYTTPDFACPSGMYCAMPRDVLLVVGNEIIEAPMAWRSRYFEFRSFRTLIKEYFRSGARWTAAPKPLMGDDLYISFEEWQRQGQDGFFSAITEVEPVFDAAEFARFGRDIFVQQSHVTNQFGVEWMRRHLGDEYTVHVLDFDDKNGMHIDGTFVPLAEGKLLVNPARPSRTGDFKTWFTYNGSERQLSLPECFRGWDIFFAPTPTVPSSVPLYFTSPWTATANLLVLDEKRVIVEAHEHESIRLLKTWGFDPIPVPFRSFLPFGGSFHCATCDVRRKGTLRSVF